MVLEVCCPFSAEKAQFATDGNHCFIANYMVLDVCCSFSAEKAQFATDGNGDYGQLWITVRHQVYFTFKVQACANISLALSTIPGVVDINTYIVGIGNGPTGIDVIIQREGKEVFREAIPNLISCEMLESFWISWAEGIIQLGRGSSYGDTGFAGFKDESPFEVNSVAMTTIGKTFGAWEFHKLAGKCLYMSHRIPYIIMVNYKYINICVSVNWFKHFKKSISIDVCGVTVLSNNICLCDKDTKEPRHSIFIQH